MAVAAVAVPLDLPPVVPFVATAAALLPLLVLAAGARRGLARVGGLARRWPRPLLAAAVVAAVWDRHLFVSSAGIAPDDVLAVATVAAAVVPFRGPRATAVLVALALTAFAVAGAILIAAKPYHSDAVVAAHGGAQLLLEGRRPYADFDMVEQLRRFGLPETFATPLEDGTRLRSLQYPALAFLVPAPFVAAGLADVRALYLVEVLAIFALVVASLPDPWRLPALAACVGGLAVVDQFVLAGIDPLWALLILGAWLARRRRSSAVLLGLAVAARQPAWLVAPFLIAYSWREGGRAEGLARAGIAAGVALLIHLPFLLTQPLALLAGVTAPALLPLEVWGVGPAKLAADAHAAVVPRAVYVAAAGAAYLAALWAFAAGRTRGGALTLPLLPLWISWRALLSYFAFLPVFTLAGDEAPRSARVPGLVAAASRSARPVDPSGDAVRSALMPVDKELLEILACPVDHAPVREEGDRLVCAQCGRRYPVRDGIPVMLVEEAEPPTP